MSSPTNEQYHAACVLLGVPATATPEEIRQAYRDLVQIWHPDRIQNERLKAKAQEQLRKINQAYSVLETAAAGAQHAPRSEEAKRVNLRPQRHSGKPVSLFRYQSWHRSGPPPQVVLLLIPLAGSLILATIVRDLIAKPAELTSIALNAAIGRGPAGLHPGRVLSPFDDVLTALESLSTWASMQSEPLQTAAPILIPPVMDIKHAKSARRPSQKIDVESPTADHDSGVLRIENAQRQRVGLELLDYRGNKLRAVTLESNSTAVFRSIPCARYYVRAHVSDRVRHIGPFDFVCVQDVTGTRADEHTYVLH
jgi:hypothetical protein